MELKRLAPQTQQTLRRLDFNRDDAISASELGRLKGQNGQLIGVAPQDQLSLKTALKQAKSPNTLIVALVDEAELPPGLKPSAPLFGERARPDAAGAKPAGKGPATAIHAKPAPAKAADDEDDSADDPPETSVSGGGLSLSASTKPGEAGKGLSREVSADYQLGGLSLNMTADANPLARGEDGTLQDLSFSGETQLGNLKLGLAHSGGNRADAGISASAEYGLIEGHGLRLEASPASSRKHPLGYSSLEVGSSHQLGNFSVNPKLTFEEGERRPTYGGGISYELNGLRFNAEADNKLNLKVGAGFFTRF